MTTRVKDANRSSLNTKAKIKESFFKLLNERSSASKITVKELCENAGIQRSTFYIHYKDIFDIEDAIINIFYEKIESFIPEAVEGPEDIEKFFIDLFDFIKTTEKDISLIFRDRKAPAIISEAINRISRRFSIAIHKGCQTINRAKAIIVLDGMFAAMYRILNGTLPIPLDELKQAALDACPHIITKQ